HGLKIDIDIASDFCEQAQAEVSRTLSELRQMNESGRPDPVRYAALERSFENAQESSKKYSEERQDSYALHGKAHREFTIALMQEMRTVGQLQVQVTAAIRRELNLKTDVAEYEARLQRNWERMDEKMRQV